MRLSTAADRDEARAIATIHAALDAGVRLLDTADAYAGEAAEIGHNERLIARALDTWTGDRGSVVVATKGGMTRPNGLWVTDGRVIPPLVATTTDPRSPVQVASARAISRSLCPISAASPA